MKTLIIAGGKATRLGKQPVPKSLMKFIDSTILEHNLSSLPKYTEPIFLLGHESKKITDYLGRKHIVFETSIEDTPEGTGGWLRKVKRSGMDRKLESLVLTENFIVCNGDNLIDIDWMEVLLEHLENKSYITILVTYVEDSYDMGTVTINDKNVITSFKEKTGIHQPGWINTGFYYFSKKGIDYVIRKTDLVKTGKIMLETDIFPQHLQSNKIFAYKHTGKWADTGTKTRIKNAEKLFGENDE